MYNPWGAKSYSRSPCRGRRRRCRGRGRGPCMRMAPAGAGGGPNAPAGADRQGRSRSHGRVSPEMRPGPFTLTGPQPPKRTPVTHKDVREQRQGCVLSVTLSYSLITGSDSCWLRWLSWRPDEPVAAAAMEHGCISFGGALAGCSAGCRVAGGGCQGGCGLLRSGGAGSGSGRRGVMSGYSAESVEEAFGQSREAFARGQEWLAGPAAAGLDHALVEEELAVRGRVIQRLMFQDYLDAQAAAEPRLAQVAGPDGVVRRRAERGHSRLLASVFGPVVVSRIAYRAAGAGNVHPLDERLGLPAGKHSDGLAKMTAAAAAAGSLAAACAQVRARTGCALGTRQAQQLARAAACDFDDFYAGRRPPPGAAPGQVLVMEVDGKAIAVRPGQLRPRAQRRAARAVPKQDGRLSRGEVRTRKRMAEVAAVFDLTPAPRPTRDILGPGPRPPGPRAAGKWLTASITADAADVIAAAFDEAGRRDPGCQQTWIALADGNKDQIRWLQDQAAARGVTLPVIIDLIHVLEYLWTAAWSFFPEASPDAGPWVRGHAAAVLDGHATGVAAAIRQASSALPP